MVKERLAILLLYDGRNIYEVSEILRKMRGSRNGLADGTKRDTRVFFQEVEEEKAKAQRRRMG